MEWFWYILQKLDYSVFLTKNWTQASFLSAQTDKKELEKNNC